MPPTGVAAINIDGTTINTEIAIPKETGDYLPAMSDQRKTQYRLALKDLKLIIVDEIYMVGNLTQLCYIFTNLLKKSLVAHLPIYLQAQLKI